MRYSIVIAALLGSAAAESCSSAFDACRSKTGANLSTCSSDFAGCKMTCATKYDTCRSTAGANLSTCASENAGCLGEIPTPSPSTSSLPTHTVVPDTCQTEYDACRIKPGANLSTCASDFAACKSKTSLSTRAPTPMPTPTSKPTTHTWATLTSAPPTIVTGGADSIKPAHVLLALGVAALL